VTTREGKRPRIRYRRITARMYNDDRFLALSPQPPSARTLWIWLLTGPLSTPVPGIVLGGVGAISDGLAWSRTATERCWQEVAGQGMAEADWTRGLIWIPKAVRHNPPENPNVVKHWRGFLNEWVPECDLRWTAEGELEVFLKAFTEAFQKAFAEGARRPFGKQGSVISEKYTPPTPREARGERPPTRAELKLAQARLDEWHREHRPWTAIEIERHQVAARRAGEPVLPADDPLFTGGGVCPHGPEFCATTEMCEARIVADIRAERARGLLKAVTA
jgi:hypothetical protein